MPTNLSDKQYFGYSLLLAGLLLATVTGFNWLVNPYLLFQPPTVQGVNEFATENFFKQLLFKPHQLRKIHPRSVIIGTSHAGVAFNPETLPQPAFNLAVGGSTSYINYRLLQEALQTSPKLEQVILEVPLFAFNALDPNNQPGHNPDFEQRLSLREDNQRNSAWIAHTWKDHIASLISWESTRSSFRMINKQRAVKSGKRGSFIQHANGQWTQQQPPQQPTQRFFENSWKKFLHDEWFPAPHYAFLLHENGNSPGLDYYQKSLLLLYQRRIQTTIIIAPTHTSLLLALQERGLWTHFETWKKELIHINQQVALEAQQEPFLIIDYSRPNAYTQEALPADDTSTQRLQWFDDSAHASSSFGDLIMQEISTRQFTIGQPLSPPLLEEIFSDHRQLLEIYSREHKRERNKILQIIQDSPAHIQKPQP